jgi:hypothetical protein
MPHSSHVLSLLLEIRRTSSWTVSVGPDRNTAKPALIFSGITYTPSVATVAKLHFLMRFQVPDAFLSWSEFASPKNMIVRQAEDRLSLNYDECRHLFTEHQLCGSNARIGYARSCLKNNRLYRYSTPASSPSKKPARVINPLLGSTFVVGELIGRIRSASRVLGCFIASFRLL